MILQPPAHPSISCYTSKHLLDDQYLLPDRLPPMSPGASFSESRDVQPIDGEKLGGCGGDCGNELRTSLATAHSSFRCKPDNPLGILCPDQIPIPDTSTILLNPLTETITGLGQELQVSGNTNAKPPGLSVRDSSRFKRFVSGFFGCGHFHSNGRDPVPLSTTMEPGTLVKDEFKVIAKHREALVGTQMTAETPPIVYRSDESSVLSEGGDKIPWQQVEDSDQLLFDTERTNRCLAGFSLRNTLKRYKMSFTIPDRAYKCDPQSQSQPHYSTSKHFISCCSTALSRFT